jgi:cephalosporin hydroxylase
MDDQLVYINHYLSLSPSDSENLFFQKKLLSGEFENQVGLDTGCTVFQTTAHTNREAADAEVYWADNGKFQKRFYNRVTHTFPSIIHANGRTASITNDFFEFKRSMSLKQWQRVWENNVHFHKQTNEDFRTFTTENSYLDHHRTHIEYHALGFGERAFPWLWMLAIADQVKPQPDPITFLEIGVYCGQVTSLVTMIAKLLKVEIRVDGLTMLSSEAGKDFPKHPDIDYRSKIAELHKFLNVRQPHIIHGDSTAAESIAKATKRGPYNIVYIDGGHDYSVVLSDLNHYSQMVKPGGLLVIDDANCNMPMPFGYFTGIASVTDALVEFMKTNSDQWEFVFSVVHISVYRRK